MDPETPADSVRALHAERTEDGLGRRIVQSAGALAPGTEAALTLGGRRRSFTTAAWTAEPAARLDGFQLSAGEGPTLEAASATGAPLRSGDLCGEARWPAFAARGQQLGVRSALFLPLYTRDGALGSLSLYAAAPNAFTPDAEAAALLLAEQASVVLAAHRTEAHLRRGLEYRDVIGQALGILMERHRITRDEAFDRLVAVSQQSNVKLRHIADTLAATGELAPPRAPPRDARPPPAAPVRRDPGARRWPAPEHVPEQSESPGAGGSHRGAVPAAGRARGEHPAP